MFEDAGDVAPVESAPDPAVAIDAPEESALLDARRGAPRLESADGTDVGVGPEGDGNVGAGAELIGLGSLDAHEDATGRVEGQVTVVERDEFRSPEGAAEADENEGSVPDLPNGFEGEAGDDGADGVGGERGGASLCGSVGATDAFPEGADFGVGGGVGEAGLEVSGANGGECESEGGDLDSRLGSMSEKECERGGFGGEGLSSEAFTPGVEGGPLGAVGSSGVGGLGSLDVAAGGFEEGGRVVSDLEGVGECRRCGEECHGTLASASYHYRTPESQRVNQF